ncbi:MAG: insulinase family protein, partial [Fidelibacterota bacterium]
EDRLTISFGCDPERVEELTTTVFQQIDSLRTYGLTEKYLVKVKEIQRRERETDLKENRFWLNILKTYDYHREDFLGIMEYEELVDSLNLEAIQTTANQYFHANSFVRVTLYPEGWQAP